MDIRRWKILAISTTLVCSLAMPVLAYTFLYRTQSYPFGAGITIQTPEAPNMALFFYKDANCTESLTSIDLGSIYWHNYTEYAQSKVYIVNAGSATTTILWISNLTKTTDVITETWLVDSVPLNGTSVQPWGMLETTYRIAVQPSPPPGNYTWTVTVWGESYL